MKISGGSFRDPSGYVFEREGTVYRRIQPSYFENYQMLMSSGLYQELLKKQLIIPHEEVPDRDGKTIRPERVFISYPYEWCFSQLKDAALVTLEIQKTALSFGMILKDASAYNIQFYKGRPVLIDTLSFERETEDRPWQGYRQFCEHFLAPLALAVKKDIRCFELLRHYLDGIPLDLACGFLPWHTWLSPSLSVHLLAHSKMQQKYAAGKAGASRMKMSRLQKEALTDHLEGTVRKLTWKLPHTEWGDYYQTCNYSSERKQVKKETIENFLGRIKPENIWDLGANTGFFSRLAGAGKIPVLSLDFDPVAVELNYRQVKKDGETTLLPLVMDLRNPSASCGWAGEERDSIFNRGPADTVLALALIHHLAIANNVPMPKLADFFAGICRRLILEFVPKDDPQVQRLLAGRDDIFPDYHETAFVTEFSRKFRILDSREIPGTPRRLFLLETL